MLRAHLSQFPGQRALRLTNVGMGRATPTFVTQSVSVGRTTKAHYVGYAYTSDVRHCLDASLFRSPSAPISNGSHHMPCCLAGTHGPTGGARSRAPDSAQRSSSSAPSFARSSSLRPHPTRMSSGSYVFSCMQSIMCERIFYSGLIGIYVSGLLHPKLMGCTWCYCIPAECLDEP